MNKQLQFVFLPANGASCIYLDDNMLFYSNGTASFHEPISKTQHLYLLSDDEIKKGDWFYTIEGFEKPLIEKAIINLSEAKHIKKIIATTNPELIKEREIEKGGMRVIDIAKISQSDIEYCISLYNGKGGKKVDKKSWKYVEGVGRVYSNKKEVDVDELAFKDCGNDSHGKEKYRNGYNRCLKDNADKKFTLEDMRNCFGAGVIHGCDSESELNADEKEFDVFIQSLTKEQPKNNTIMVEYENIYGESDYVGISSPLIEKDIYKPKLDKHGNIIIVR